MSTLMAEGVGKRIVDALKMQSELEIVDKTQDEQAENIQVEETVSNEISDEVSVENFNFDTELTANQVVNPTVNQSVNPALNQVPVQPQFQTAVNYGTPNVSVQSVVTPQVQPVNNFTAQQNLAADFSNQEVPQNVTILRQLIAQLPSGVSRQAGAVVIKQTMEALGISMKSVLQEAQQLQESISLSARECQSSILECKKQINNLELQVQQYQKQSSSLNDIISLFVQIN